MAESVAGTFTVGEDDLIIEVIAEGTWPTTDPQVGWIVGYNWRIKNQATKARLFITWIGHQTLAASTLNGLQGSIRFPNANVAKRMKTGFYIEHRTVL